MALQPAVGQQNGAAPRAPGGMPAHRQADDQIGRAGFIFQA